jgi:hypothetical protein
VDQRPSQVQPAAICLIITGAFNAALGLLGIISQFIQMSDPARSPITGSEATRIGYVTGQFMAASNFFLSLVAAPMIIYGAVKMLRGSSHGWAKAASILAIVPVTSCCFLIGAPIGIWALVVLSKPEVKMFYGLGGANNEPPPPPQYYSST